MLASQRDPTDPFYIPEFRTGNRVMPDFRLNPAGIAATQRFVAGNQMTGSAPMMAPQQLGGAWPMFNNEMEKQSAIATGAVDYNYPTPQAKTLYGQMTARDASDLAAGSAAATLAARSSYGDDPSMANLRNLQLAGDSSGDVKHLLQGMQVVPTIAGEYGPLDPNRLGGVNSLQPYNPSDYGGSPTASDGINPRLDTKLVNSRDFQKMLVSDPQKAAFVYKKLKGRDYQADVEAYTKNNERTGKEDFDFVQRQKEQGGLQIDPDTGRTLVWNRVMPAGDEKGMSLSGGGGSTQPQMQLTYATPDQEAMIRRGWAAAHQGQARPTIRPTSAVDQQFIARNEAQDPEYAKAKGTLEHQLGRRLNGQEAVDLAAKLQRTRSAVMAAGAPNQEFMGSAEKGVGWFPRLAANTAGGILGLKPVERPEFRNVWQAMQDDNQQSPTLNALAPLAWPMAAYRGARNWWNRPTPSTSSVLANPPPFGF